MKLFEPVIATHVFVGADSRSIHKFNRVPFTLTRRACMFRAGSLREKMFKVHYVIRVYFASPPLAAESNFNSGSRPYVGIAWS